MENSKELDTYLEAQISEKRIVVSNLNAEINQLKVKAEYDVQLELLRAKKKNNKDKEVFVRDQDSLTKREYSIKIQEDVLKRRDKEIAKRENMMLDLEKQRMRLFEERRDFLVYQREEQKKIDSSQEIVQEAKYKEDIIKQKEDDLFDLEERVLAKKEIFDRREHEVQTKEKELKVKQANFEALTKGDKYDRA